MTCIVGIADGSKVWIGGDSAGVDGWNLILRADTKVFANGPMLFGFTSSFRMGQLLRHSLIIPPQHEDPDDKWLCTTFIDAVRQCLKDGGYTTTKEGAEVGGCFIIGYKGQLYMVASDFQVAKPSEQYAAIGSGDHYALGSLHSSTGQPERRIRTALQAAAHFSIGVSAPFHVIKGAP